MLADQLAVSVLARGSQILALDRSGVRITDSFLLLPMALRKFTSAFGLKKVGRKGKKIQPKNAPTFFSPGHFPFRLNSTRYLNGAGAGGAGHCYETPGLPPIEYRYNM